MEEKYGQASRIWVMDRGMVSEENLDSLRERKAAYIVGTPKGQLRQFEGQLLDEHDWSQVQPGVEVKLVHILIVTLSHSRKSYVETVLSQNTAQHRERLPPFWRCS